MGDNSGLGNAVAAGATEVVVFLNVNSTASPDLELLTTGGPKPPNPGTPDDLYPLFQTSLATFRSAFEKFHQLVLPARTQFLKSIIVGTINMVTADNKYFGLTAGKNVTVHVVQTSSSLNIGFFEKYVNYGTFAQEIALAINSQENEAFVKNTLLPMVMGASSGTEFQPTVVV